MTTQDQIDMVKSTQKWKRIYTNKWEDNMNDKKIS